MTRIPPKQLGSSRLDPAQITADQNDYSPTGWVRGISHLFIDSDASRTITGFAASSFGDTEEVVVVNDGSNDIIIAHDSVSSTLGNRVLVDGGADFTLGANQAGRLLRDATTGKWRFYALNDAAGGGGGTFVGNETITAEYISTDTALADTLDNTPLAGTFAMFVDGIRMTEGVHFSLSGTTITWLGATSGFELLSTNTIRVQYSY